VAHPGQSVDRLTEAELCFGPFLLQEKSTVFLEKWASELAANQEILSKIPASAQQKQAEFSAKIAKIKEVLNVS
jgi:tRNA (adenine22-N1)-methyltransferase